MERSGPTPAADDAEATHAAARCLPAQDASHEAPLPADAGHDPTRANQRAFLTLLFNKYRGALLRHVERLVRSREDAAELVQETYVRVMDHVEASRFEAAARSYLFQTATNLARDHHRRQRFRAHDRLDALPEGELPVGDAPPETQVAAEQVYALIRSTIAELPPATRTVFLKARLENLSYAEIARELDTSVRTIERRMAEAMAALVARLKDAP